MSSIFIILLLALLPVLIIYLFYLHYFNVKPSYLYHLEYFIYGILLASLILISSPYLFKYLSFKSPVAIGFLHAALIEKAGAFLLIIILMQRSTFDTMVLNSVISAMLLGIGFATLENIMYALAIHESIIIVRLLSSVPLHVLTCGLIGYYLALMKLSGSRFNKIRLFFKALIIPFLFHGLFDTLLIYRETLTYVIALLLIFLIIIMEYILAKSQTLPLLDGLQSHNLALEDWETVQREPQYERWILRSMGSQNKEYVPLIRLNLGKLKIFIILIMVAVAVPSLFYHEFIIEVMQGQLKTEEVIMLFTFLPLLYALNLFTIGVVNPKYFQNSIIKIPIIIDVDFTLDSRLVKTITYHITGRNCYLKTVDPIESGNLISMTFHCAGFSSPLIQGFIIWDTHDEQKQLSGTLVKFLKRKPWGFRFFLIRYYFYKIFRGLFFNLRLPGFKSIRQLFVRPVSVMQKEWRFSAGQRLFEQGESGNVFYLIRKGQIDIIKTLETGEEVLMTTLEEGDIFGEMAIVGNQPRLATAVCRTDCLLAVAEADNLAALIENNPLFTHKLIKNFANRLHASEQIMLQNISALEQTIRMKERTLLAIIKMFLINSDSRSDDNSITVSVDTARIADILGIEQKKVLLVLKLLLKSKDLTTIDEKKRGTINTQVIKAYDRYRLIIKHK